ncbi:MAG: EF-hand domain-containing protein [Pseudomonadota bacterium]|nr:EF-hand domain-containing protein [Pseudomonadota bacterium]
MKTIQCNVLAVALTAALASPFTMAQSNVENPAEGPRKVQDVPRAPMSPPVTPQMPVAEDAATAATDRRSDERPMTSTASTPPRDQWTSMDTDGDGRISEEEARAGVTFDTHFSMMDTNGDGFISMEEHREHVRQMASDQGMERSGQEARQAGNRDVPPAHSQAAEHAAPHSAAAQQTLWSELDTDEDGRISSVESSMDPQLRQDFTQLDIDSDGFLSSAEYRDGMQEDRVRYSGDTNIDEEPEAGNDARGREDSGLRDEAGTPVEDDRDGGG